MATISQGAQYSKIGARDNGEVEVLVVEDRVVIQDVEGPMVEVEALVGVVVDLVVFDPFACHRCGVHGHLARDCPSASTQSLSGGSSGTIGKSSFRSRRTGPRRGRGMVGKFGLGD